MESQVSSLSLVEVGIERNRVHPEDRARQSVACLDFMQGLVSCHEEIYRVRHERGDYSTVLAPGAGTTLRCCCPLNANGEMA